MQCPKCGTDNLLNVSSARCGTPGTEHLKPEVFQDTLLTQRIAKIVNIVLGIVLTLLIIVVVVGALYPVSGRIGSNQ